MRMKQIAKSIGLCTIGFTGGMIFTGYQLGELALHNDQIRKWVGQAIGEYAYDILNKEPKEQIFEEWEDTTILFETHEEAMTAVGKLLELCGQCGEVTLADLYTVCKLDLSKIYSNIYALGWKEDDFAIKVEPFRIHKSGGKELKEYYKMIFMESPRKLC